MKKENVVLSKEKKDETTKLLETFALITKENREKALLVLEGMALASAPATPKATA